IGASHGHSWPGICAALLFAAWQLALSQRRIRDLRLIAAALALGTLLDGGAAASGLIHYAANSLALPPGGAPLWILALWGAFGLTLRSLNWLAGRPWLGMLLGAVGAPLSYGSASRGWHVLTFAPPWWHGVLWLAVGWALAMALLIGLIARGSPARNAGAWISRGKAR
ncbi:MAG: DUF2878 domain-containing protein, partial [Steroidobacteraceae bacterium]